MVYRIRAAEAKDLYGIEELEQQCFSFPHTFSQLESELGDPLYTLLVAETEEKILGYAGLMHVEDEGYITNIAVQKDARRKGIAQALLSSFDELAEELKLAFISLEVRSGNLPAIRLYEKNGYQRQSVLRDYYSSPREDGLVMTKYRQLQ